MPTKIQILHEAALKAIEKHIVLQKKHRFLQKECILLGTYLIISYF